MVSFSFVRKWCSKQTNQTEEEEEEEEEEKLVFAQAEIP
jgi:hypothetical protein